VQLHNGLQHYKGSRALDQLLRDRANAINYTRPLFCLIRTCAGWSGGHGTVFLSQLFTPSYPTLAVGIYSSSPLSSNKRPACFAKKEKGVREYAVSACSLAEVYPKFTHHDCVLHFDLGYPSA